MKNFVLIILLILLLNNTAHADEIEETEELISKLDLIIEEIEDDTYSRSVKISKNEIELLARLIQSESLGESYEGKLAVGTVVVNRADKSNGHWWSNSKYTITSVIYRSGQFDGVGSDLWNQALDEDCLRAAEQIANGYRHFEKEIVFFHNPKTSTDVNHMRRVDVVYEIGRHVFGKKK